MEYSVESESRHETGRSSDRTASRDVRMTSEVAVRTDLSSKVEEAIGHEPVMMDENEAMQDLVALLDSEAD
jgi:hypothetical protein